MSEYAFLLQPLLAGLVAATVTGPVGCIAVWRRIAFFGGALAHGTLLGVAVALAAELDVTAGILAVSVLAAVALAAMEGQRRLAGDTLIGIIAHAALALGVVVLAFLPGVRGDLMGYLFGDILAVGASDLWWLAGGGAVALAALAALWRPVLAVTVHEDLARVEGVPAGAMRLAAMLLIALVVALTVKIVGVLMVAGLLIVPAAAARRLARTPEGMALGAAALGWLAVVGGLAASLAWNTPAAPSIVVAATVLFALLWSVPRRA